MKRQGAGGMQYIPYIKTIEATSQSGLDIIGDVHGCIDELLDLLRLNDYHIEEAPNAADPLERYKVSHPQGRQVIFVGDLVDRGQSPLEVLRLVRCMAEQGIGTCVIGNHDYKALRALTGANVKIAHGLGGTLNEINNRALPGERQALIEFMAAFPTMVRIPTVTAEGEEQLHIVVHAAAAKVDQGEINKATFEHAIFGFPIKATETTPFGREDWAEDYRGDAYVIHGHEAGHTVVAKNRVTNIDTGCAFGSMLTMMRMFEGDFISVPSRETYFHKEGFSPDASSPLP
jgi:protein phosphatase